MPPLSLGSPISPAEPFSQAYSLAIYMQKNTSTLLQIYMSDTAHERGSEDRDTTFLAQPYIGETEQGQKKAPLWV